MSLPALFSNRDDGGRERISWREARGGEGEGEGYVFVHKFNHIFDHKELAQKVSMQLQLAIENGD